jgi:uncharacterized membrane protein
VIIKESIEVQRPLNLVYDQWTQFEEFPQFMPGVKLVRQLDDAHLHWQAQVGGKTKEWEAEIVDQVPEERIAWRSTRGATLCGVVRFTRLGPNRTRLSLTLNYEPNGILEKIGDFLGLVAGRVAGDLQGFKHFIEGRGVPTGSWRGVIYDSVRPLGPL